MENEIITPKNRLLVKVTTRGEAPNLVKTTVKLEATCRDNRGWTDEWSVTADYNSDSDPEWTEIYDLASALADIDESVDNFCEMNDSAIYQL